MFVIGLPNNSANLADKVCVTLIFQNSGKLMYVALYIVIFHFET